MFRVCYPYIGFLSLRPHMFDSIGFRGSIGIMEEKTETTTL